MVDGRGLRLRTLALVAAGVGLGAYLLLRLWFGRGGGPAAPAWPAAALPVVIGAGLLWTARRIRLARAGRTRRPIDVIGVYRSLMLAQACALTGAVLTGWYTAYGILRLPDADVASVRGDVVLALVAVLAAILMSGAGLVVQRACRIDPPDGPPGD